MAPVRNTEKRVAHDQRIQDRAIAKVQIYGRLLLRGPHNEPRIAMRDAIVQDQESGGPITSRTSFYEIDGGYHFDETYDRAAIPRIRSYMRPNPDAEADHSRWLVGFEDLEWLRFSPGPSHDVRPFVALLVACFGDLPY